MNSWSVKALTGKSISADMATYLEGVSLKNDFIKLHNVLRLKRSKSSNRMSNVEEIVGMTTEALAELVTPIVERGNLEKKH